MNSMTAVLRDFAASTALEQAEAAAAAARREQASAEDAAEELEYLSDAPLEQLVGLGRADVGGDSSSAVEQLRDSGRVRVDGALSRATVATLLKHVDKCLLAARARLATTPNAHQATKYLGHVRRPINRTDLKLEMLPPVAAALAEALEPLRAVCSALLGADAELFELGAFLSDPGAPRQGVHPDTQFTASAAACSTLVALQDVDQSMGPTEFLPGTHTEAAHTALQTRTVRIAKRALTPEELATQKRAHALAYLRGDKRGEGEQRAAQIGARERLLRSSARELATLSVGDAVMFDTRVLHCGGANVSTRRRALLYFSFRVPGAHTPYGRGSLDMELQARTLQLHDSPEWLRKAQRRPATHQQSRAKTTTALPPGAAPPTGHADPQAMPRAAHAPAGEQGDAMSIS